jgi:hypothetical protein
VYQRRADSHCARRPAPHHGRDGALLGRYIMGYEYYAPETTAINYRGNEGFLWKANFAQLFLNNFPELRLVKQRLYSYINDAERGNQDVVYLLEKTTA